MAPGQLVTSTSQPLPQREAGLFRKIVKCYEGKQHRVGLKHAKTILDKFPNHGETLSMKGLLLQCLGRRDEARETVGRGLRNDIKSHICWHVFGLIERADKKYEKAMTSYKMALKLDPDNTQILRDLSLLQVQMRDYEGYAESRRQMLIQRNNRMNWISYATSRHLVKDYEMAIELLKNYATENPKNVEFDYDYSELTMYQVMLYREWGKLNEAMETLEQNASLIVDQLGYHETRAELLMEQGKHKEAEDVYWQLVKRNPERALYYKMIEKCRGLGEGDVAARLEIYEQATKDHPRAGVPQRLPLLFVEGAELEKRLRPFIIKGVRKGVPSLFKNIVPLYSNPGKVAVVERLLLDFVKKLGTGADAALDDSEYPDAPTSALWLYYFLAQHYDRLGMYSEAMQYIDCAYEHTPTLIEILMAKAKIYKHKGDLQQAADLMVEAQSLDTADRYINSKCAKYLLRAGRIKEAEEMCGKFTRENTNPTDCLTEMQCMWYEVERARAFYNAKDFGKALMHCHQINSHFDTFYDDQYDFHSYCVRKMTLSSYIKLLRLEDVMRYHRYFIEGMKIAVKIYLRKLDCPSDFIEEEEENDENMSKADKLKAKRKAQKELARKKAAEAEEAKKQPKNQQKKNEEPEGVAMVKYDPEKLLQDDPLAEASKFASFIIRLAEVNDVEAFVLAFEVFFKKEKVLLMLQCLNRANQLNPDCTLVKSAMEKFLKYYKSQSFDGQLAEMTKIAVEKLYGSQLTSET